MNAASPKAYTLPDVEAMPAEMPPPLHLVPLPLAPVGTQAVALACDGGRVSSDAGLVLLHDPDAQLGLTRALAAGLRDPRAPRRVPFTLHALLKQRVLQIAAGYEEANDATTLRHDPLFPLLRDRRPESGPPVASPPTRACCENRVSRSALSRMAPVLVEPFIASDDQTPQRIVLDFDDTEDPAPGAQEQVRDDGYEGGYCFLPLHVYEGLSGRLITTIFQAKRFSGAQRLSVLRRLVKRLRQAWPDTVRLVRGASPFASPEVMQWSEAQAHLRYVTGLTSHAVFTQLAHEVVEPANRAYGRDGGKRTRFHATGSQAGTWSRSRRVVSKGAGSDQGGNTRCVVTD